LLNCARAAVYRRYPSTLILKEDERGEEGEPSRLKIDPGSKATGIAVVNDASGQVVWAGEQTHRGEQVKARLEQRRACRRSRRQRHTRYRPARFLNRRRRSDWLPPSMESRIANALTWVARLRRWCRVGALSLELVKFDTHLLQNAEISGIEYQQGELAGYEVREYLLEKWGRKCSYCKATNVPLQIEHIVPQVRHGSHRVSTLTIACKPCNDAKGTRTAAEFGHPHIQAQAKQPLRDAAAVNATRWAFFHQLAAQGPPLEMGTGDGPSGTARYASCPRRTGLTPPVWAPARRRCSRTRIQHALSKVHETTPTQTG
jgi:5-methylcytosine-specific restriction endonuclease McrA